jgi:hypothetical protein
MDVRGEQRNVGKLSGTTPGRPGAGTTSGVPIRIHEEPPSGTTTSTGVGERGPSGTPGQEFQPEQFKENATKLLNDMKSLAWGRVRSMWEGFNRPETWDKISSTYVQSSLKVDEAKHILSEIKCLPLNASISLCCAACKNLSERQELLKRYLDDYKGKEIKKKEFYDLEKEFLESIQRFVELVLYLGLNFQDAFECGINDYSLSLQKAQRYRDRYEDFKKFKGKMDHVTYKKNRHYLRKEKCDAIKEAASAKVCTEEIYHKILHFYQDVNEGATDVMDFLRTRSTDVDNLSKGRVESPTTQQTLNILSKRYPEVRDLLEEVVRISRDKIPHFSNKKEIENLVSQRRKFFETKHEGREGREGTREGREGREGIREGTQRGTSGGIGAEK